MKSELNDGYNLVNVHIHFYIYIEERQRQINVSSFNLYSNKNRKF